MNQHPTWRKSSHSSPNNACIEVAISTDAVAIRDTKDADGPHLHFGTTAFAAFLAAVKNGTAGRRT